MSQLSNVIDKLSGTSNPSDSQTDQSSDDQDAPTSDQEQRDASESKVDKISLLSDIIKYLEIIKTLKTKLVEDRFKKKITDILPLKEEGTKDKEDETKGEDGKEDEKEKEKEDKEQPDSSISVLGDIVKKFGGLALLGTGILGLFSLDSAQASLGPEPKTDEPTKPETPPAPVPPVAAQPAAPPAKITPPPKEAEAVKPPPPKKIEPASEAKSKPQPQAQTAPTSYGTSRLPKVTGKTVDPNEVYSYLASLGLDDFHIRGMMANIKHESSFQPNAQGREADGTYSIGFFQWRGPRKAELIKTIPDWETNWKGQLNFALKEDAGPLFVKTKFTSAEEASKFWTKRWERPADAEATADKRALSAKEFIQPGKMVNKPNQGQQLASASVSYQQAEEQSDRPTVVLIDNSKKITNRITAN